MTTKGIRQDVMERGGVFASVDKISLVDIQTGIDILEANQRKHNMGIYIHHLDEGRREYIEWEGKHYMTFKNVWYNYSPANGHTREIDEPEWVIEMKKNYTPQIIHWA